MKRFQLACQTLTFREQQTENREQVLRAVAEAGWDGAEGLGVDSPAELVELACLARRYGLHLVNMRSAEGISTDSIEYNVTLGNDTAEVTPLPRRAWGGDHPTDADVERAARSLDTILATCAEYGIKGFQHAHLWLMIETIDDAERLLAAAPNLWLLFDTGHFLAAGSDPMHVFRSPILRHRIGHVHLKDFHADDPATWDHRTSTFGEHGRFAELGQGNVGLDVRAVLRGLEEVGYDGWVSVELDRPYPVRPPAESVRRNRDYLRRLGY